jgi:hypothetical protein
MGAPESRDSEAFSSFLQHRGTLPDGLRSADLLGHFAPPGPDDYIQHLSRFELSTQHTCPSSEYLDRASEALTALTGDIPTLPTSWLTPAALLDVTVPQTTSPGLAMRKLGFRTKADAHNYALREATEIVEGFVAGRPYREDRVASLAGRGKIVLPGQESPRQGRLILVVDLVVHLISSLAS